MRISSLAITLLLFGCNDREKSNGPAPLAVEPSVVAAAPFEPSKTLCAVDGDAEFVAVCSRELIDGLLTLRHPNGGFRRLEIVTDGRGVIAADGAEPASVKTVGTKMIEVRIGGDRYRLPAEVRN